MRFKLTRQCTSSLIYTPTQETDARRTKIRIHFKYFRLFPTYICFMNSVWIKIRARETQPLLQHKTLPRTIQKYKVKKKQEETDEKNFLLGRIKISNLFKMFVHFCQQSRAYCLLYFTMYIYMCINENKAI